MTRATDKPVRRIVTSKYDGDLVIEVRAGTATIRPPRTRKGGKAEVVVSWGHIYNSALKARVSN